MNTTIKTHIAMLTVAAGVLLVSACSQLTTEADCRSKGGTWKEAPAGHFSGAGFMGCDATPILP